MSSSDSASSNDSDTLAAIKDDWKSMETADSPPKNDVNKTKTTQNGDLKPNDPANPTTDTSKGLGEKISVKDLYPSDNSTCKCCVEWVEEPPFNKEVESSAKKRGEHSAFAIIRKREAHGGGQGWKTTSITINSPYIKSALQTIFAGYPSVDVNTPELLFEAPFIPFLHRWGAVEDTVQHGTDGVNSEHFIEREKGTEKEHATQEEQVAEKDVIDKAKEVKKTKEHLDLLVGVLQPDLESFFGKMAQFKNTGYIHFEDLIWAFVPGETIISDVNGTIRAGICRESIIVSEPFGQYFLCTVVVVDFNGLQYGVKTQNFRVDGYMGMKQLHKLQAYPLLGHPDASKIREDLIARGKKAYSLRRQEFRSYNGKARGISNKHSPMMRSGGLFIKNERVIVDTLGYYSLQGQSPPKLDPLETLVGPSLNGNKHKRGYENDSDDDYRGHDEDRESSERPTAKKKYNQAEIDIPKLSDEQMLLLPSVVKGFALSSKRWCEFEVNLVRDIVWTANVFENVVLGEKEKRLIISLLSHSSASSRSKFDDFIPGKGTGTIFLLCGPPGVGKTLTAESISEYMKKPLYRIGLQDLDTWFVDLETALKHVLECCSRWDAVLLLDEADVFLEKRSTQSLSRNNMVSVFLRLLEYYEGTMILTTNRLETIDPAFESRIDIILPYEGLNHDSRVQIWRNFLKKLEPKDYFISDKEIDDLGHHQLNGRQIKSAIKTSCMLALNEELPLSMHHLEMVISLRDKAAIMMKTRTEDL